jgi:hypothetical protein
MGAGDAKLRPFFSMLSGKIFLTFRKYSSKKACFLYKYQLKDNLSVRVI